MIDPKIVEQWAQVVSALVVDVENRVILRVRNTVEQDLGASWWDVTKVRDTAALRAVLAKQLGEDWQTVLDEAQAVLNQAADAGQGQARIDLAEWAESTPIQQVWAQQTTLGVGQIARDALKHLTDLPALILRDAVDAYQRIMTVPVTEVTMGATARRQATEHALQQFAARGIDSFEDKAGRRWRIDSYAEMATRTGAQNAMRYGYEQTLTNRGKDLVMVTGHGYTCSKCGPWQGAVLSLTGATPVGWNMLPSAVEAGQTVRVQVAGTLDQAKAEGLFHPNCAHGMALFLPGASRPARMPQDAVSYEASQKQRALEREIRAEKRRLAASFDPAAAYEHRANIRAYQKQIRELIAEHPKLARKSVREQIKTAH